MADRRHHSIYVNPLSTENSENFSTPQMDSSVDRNQYTNEKFAENSRKDIKGHTFNSKGKKSSSSWIIYILFFVIGVLMIDRYTLTLSVKDLCDNQIQGKPEAYRYDSSKYVTQVLPSIAGNPPGYKNDGSMKRIVITGGAGFIGSHLVDKLMEEGHAVTIIDNFFTGSRDNVRKWIGHPRFQIVEWDVILPIFIDCDQIYHLACPASPRHYQEDPVFTIKTNVMGTLNMLGVAARTGARFLLASTSEVYGDPLEHPQTESYRGNVNTTGIRSCYDEGKRVAETLAFDFHREKNVDIRVARIFNTYGDRMNIEDGRVVSNFIVQHLRGQSFELYGGGQQTRSFCYVDDLVNGLYKLMNTEGVTGPTNLGNPTENTIRELAEAVALTIDGDLSNLNVIDKPLPSDDPTRRKPDISKAKKELDWEPEIKLRDGLEKAVAYFKEAVQ